MGGYSRSSRRALLALVGARARMARLTGVFAGALPRQKRIGSEARLHSANTNAVTPQSEHPLPHGRGCLLFIKGRQTTPGIHSAANAAQRQIASLPALTRAGCGRCPGPCRRRSGTAPEGRSPSVPAAPPRGCPARWTRRPSSACGCPGPGRFACCGSPSWW